jgi:hypothetical protein
VAAAAKNARNDATSPTTRVTAPNTTAFAASTRGRRGTAASVARMVPELYSLVMVSTPSAPTSSRPGTTPASALLIRSPDPSRVFRPTAIAIPMVPAAVRARVHQVERRLRNLIHSIRAASASPYRSLLTTHPDIRRFHW